MLKENLLWHYMIEPINGRIVKEPTLLGIVLGGIAFAIALAALAGLFLYIV